MPFTSRYNKGKDTACPWPNHPSVVSPSPSPRSSASNYPISDLGDRMSARESPSDHMFGKSEGYELVLETTKAVSPVGSLLSAPNCTQEPRVPSPLSTSPSASMRSSRLSPSNQSSFAADQRFKIRNADTGEEIDLRDENQTDFVQQLARVLSSSQQDLQEYW